MGKSYQNYDKGSPKRRVRSDEDEEDFDWREELHRIEAEEEAENEKENEISLGKIADELEGTEEDSE